MLENKYKSKPKTIAITPPPMPGPIYAYEGRDNKNNDKNKIDLFIASSFIS